MKQKHGPKNLKNLDYQPAELKTETLSDENKSDLKQLTSSKAKQGTNTDVVQII